MRFACVPVLAVLAVLPAGAAPADETDARILRQRVIGEWDCADHYKSLAADGVYQTYESQGTWRLDGRRLTLAYRYREEGRQPDPDGPVTRLSFLIVESSRTRLRLRGQMGDESVEQIWRRCG